MLSNLAVGLILSDRIETTLTKAKALRPFIEKVITKAKKAAALPKKDGKLTIPDAILQQRRDQLAQSGERIFKESGFRPGNI